jgi:hypothetical protein
VTDEPTSGNRWEPPRAGAPDDGGTPAEGARDAAPQEHPHPTGAQEPVTVQCAPGHAGWRPRLTAARTKLAATAAVVFLGGGAAGFAVGHEAAGHGDGSTSPGQTRFDPDGDGQRPDFGGRHDGPGTLPGQRGDGFGAGES